MISCPLSLYSWPLASKYWLSKKISIFTWRMIIWKSSFSSSFYYLVNYIFISFNVQQKEIWSESAPSGDRELCLSNIVRFDNSLLLCAIFYFFFLWFGSLKCSTKFSTCSLFNITGLYINSTLVTKARHLVIREQYYPRKCLNILLHFNYA